jgi:hypothetical protein
VAIVTFLEEAILSQSWKGVRAAIENKAQVNDIGKYLKKRYGYGSTLLHLAVLSPEEMRELCQLKRIGKEESLEDPHVSSDVVAELLTSKPEENGRINANATNKEKRASYLAEENMDKIKGRNDIKNEYEKVINAIKKYRYQGARYHDVYDEREKKMRRVRNAQ